jgi:regulator of sigma E protease
MEYIVVPTLAIMRWFYRFVPNYGVAIILLTVLVRIVLLPLGIRQIKSMQNMQRLQPKIKALQAKYKGNKTKQQEEIMKLYKEQGVNPLSGCWPVLLQFPLLIAMYAVIRPPVVSPVKIEGRRAYQLARQGKPVEIPVEPTSMRDFGLVMTMDPISAVQPDSPAKTAGLEPGDKILSIDGQPVGNPITLPYRMRRAAQDGKTINLEIERKSEPKPLTLSIMPRVPESADELLPTNPMSAPALGIAYKVWTKVTAVNANTPAADAKLQPGDEIISARYIAPSKKDAAAKDKDTDEPTDSAEPTKIEFDGKDPAWPYFVWEVLTFADPAARWELEVRSGKETRKVELQTAESKDEAGRVLHSQARGFLFQPLFSVHIADSFASAVRLGGRETLDNLLLVYRFLQKIGQKQISVKLLGGPVEIFRQAGRSAQQGWSDFLLFLTMLSANLAVINFLPIPVLDGGHMVFLAYELIRGKPASERVVVAFTYAGLIFILSLMMFVLALDTGLISRR